MRALIVINGMTEVELDKLSTVLRSSPDKNAVKLVCLTDRIPSEFYQFPSTYSDLYLPLQDQANQALARVSSRLGIPADGNTFIREGNRRRVVTDLAGLLGCDTIVGDSNLGSLRTTFIGRMLEGTPRSQLPIISVDRFASHFSASSANRTGAGQTTSRSSSTPQGDDTSAWLSQRKATSSAATEAYEAALQKRKAGYQSPDNTGEPTESKAPTPKP